MICTATNSPNQGWVDTGWWLWTFMVHTAERQCTFALHCRPIVCSNQWHLACCQQAVGTLPAHSCHMNSSSNWTMTNSGTFSRVTLASIMANTICQITHTCKLYVVRIYSRECQYYHVSDYGSAEHEEKLYKLQFVPVRSILEGKQLFSTKISPPLHLLLHLFLPF